MESLPPELAEIVIGHLSLQEKLGLRKASRRLNCMVVARTPALCPPDHAHFDVLKLQQLPGILHVSSLSVDLPMAQHLVPLAQHALKTWKRRRGEKVDCFATFVACSDHHFALFDSATINHLDVSRLLPVFCEGDKLQQVQHMLAGCRVGKTTLVFDKQTLRNLHYVPPFLASIACRSVHFYLERSLYYDMLTPFADPGLAASLVAAGVETVAFSGSPGFGRRQPHSTIKEDASGWHGPDKPLLAMPILLCLFGAGIKQIDVGANSLQNTNRYVTVESLDTVITSLASLARPLRLRVTLLKCVSRLTNGTNVNNDEGELRRVVRVANDAETSGQLITIEIGCDDEKMTEE